MHVVSRVLVRAPLLLERDLAHAETAFAAHPLGSAALRLASPSLHAHARADRASRRYAQRAAFRATPQGLLAGVVVAELHDGPSRFALGATPRAVLTPSFARLHALSRALLHTDAGWRAAKLRQAPSLLRAGLSVRWLSFGEGEASALEAEVDPLLEALLGASQRWISTAALARRLRAHLPDTGAARTFLLELVDDGLLHSDLEPPLVGVGPQEFARGRLAALCPQLGDILDRLGDTSRSALVRIEEAEAALSAMPGAGEEAPALSGVLVHGPTSKDGRGEGDALRIDRRPVESAATLAPLLFALADALHPPVAEAGLQPGLADALQAVSALGGEGLVSLPELELGAHGARLRAEATTSFAPSMQAIAYLAGLVTEAARAGREEIMLDVDLLARVVPEIDVPASFELQLAPTLDEDGWLLGVHAPAGASWGRYAHAMGDELMRALVELREAEQVADGEALRVDVSYAPSVALADLCCVPALREAALAVSSWPEDASLRPADCTIANQPASLAHGGFAVGDRALRVSPLHRVRSSTAPPSVWRALLGDTLHRQHAPWALGWGALATLPWLPRARLGGFVIAPQSWALPEDATPATVDALRRQRALPRYVQVGAEDALLPVDLDAPTDVAALCALLPAERRRAFEIWPPLGRTLDEGGRRLELIAAVVRGGEEARTAALAAMSRVPTPRPQSGWRTIKIFASREQHDAVLADRVAPAVRMRGVLDWFFLPYVDPPAREHLRLRIRASSDEQAASTADRITRELLLDPRVVAVEIGGYHAEHARWGPALPAVERVFASDSQLVIDLLLDRPELPDEAILVLGYDALADGMGLTQEARLRRCEEALAAYRVDDEEERASLAPGYRLLQRSLLAALASPPGSFSAHRTRVRKSGIGSRAGLAFLPALAHLAAVRLCGIDREAEVRALYLWKRALMSRVALGKTSLPRRRKARSARPPRDRG